MVRNTATRLEDDTDPVASRLFGDLPEFGYGNLLRVVGHPLISFSLDDPRGREQVRRLSRDGIEVDSLGRVADFRVRRFRFESN